jgi:predicted CXXCH cytochrome family protein
MDPAKGFRGTPTRRDIPRLCGGCHADARLIKRYAPNLPTDQLSQYETSQHANQLRLGNARAAVCTSCHGAHGIVPARDPRSPVYPTHVVETCAGCHARPGGAGPVADYKRSVHYALLLKGDLSAPTCNRCHGSHGATPPGVQSVSNVCGQCHPRNMEIFRASPHQAAFETMKLGACTTCHGNHAILAPADAWVGVGEPALCGRCHGPEDPGGKAALAIRTALDNATGLSREAQARVEAARARGMLMIDAQVDLQDAQQRVVQARTLVHAVDVAQVEQHTNAAATSARKALDAAARAFAELRYRRAGLLVALFVILVAIVALWLEIRRVDARRRLETRRKA